MTNLGHHQDKDAKGIANNFNTNIHADNSIKIENG